MPKSLILVCCILTLAAIPAGAQTPPLAFDVTKYGAVGDGKTLNTAAIQKAIEAATVAGGGTVCFPAGVFVSGTIRLRSNLTIYLGPGAELQASSDPLAYDEAEPNPWVKYQDYGHSHFHNSLVWGENLDNVSILGPGRIYGKGLVEQNDRREGNKAIALKACRNVTLRDFTILMGGHFGVLATGVDNLTIDNLKIDTQRDGVDIDSCRNVRVSNCTVNSPRDDGICLKSDYALGLARATENVTITNCGVSGYAAGSVLAGTYDRAGGRGPYGDAGVGRIKFGTESNGGFRNITISNCTFDHCCGLGLITVDGGPLEDVTVTNLTMRDLLGAPFFFRLGTRMRGPESAPAGALRRVNISNVVANNADARICVIITGVPGRCIEDVKLSNIRIYCHGGGTKAQAGLNPPEKVADYPQDAMFGITPAYGFYIRHVKNIQLDNVQISCLKEDQRPAFVLDDVRGVELNRVKAPHAAGVPTFVLKSVTDFNTHRTCGLPDISLRGAVSTRL